MTPKGSFFEARTSALPVFLLEKTKEKGKKKKRTAEMVLNYLR